MSQENVDLNHQANDAFNRRDLHAFLALMDRDAEFIPYEIRDLGERNCRRAAPPRIA
jgi:hypothetical protein